MKSILNIKNKILKILGNKVTVFAVVLFIPLFFNVYAQTSTLSATPTAPDFIENKEIQNLKEKIATKVAELREKNVKAVSGVVQEFTSSNKLTGTKIMIKTWKDENFQIVVDPVLTKFFQITGEQKKEVNLKSLKKNIYIIVTGIIKDNSIDANIVYLDELFIVGSGKVTEVNKEDYFISVITSDKEKYTLDIETFTKQLLLNIKTLVPENVGFSKIKEGDSIHFVVKKTGAEKELNRYSAQKILTIPQEYFVK
ncbi:hypothetical protein A2767_06405 [Candidatus Roizmanbacteria bacterium RIFCSPHIGHO2_01_FULL_35_10]|nr:MAG: hypothetical protein A2767_06405 [Candidatus Roizmanbacteria bacterium RIFCSPHIGHO2_01_FULL_35_10]